MLQCGIEVEKIDLGVFEVEGEGAAGGGEKASSFVTEHAAQFGEALSEVGEPLFGVALGPESAGEPVSLDGTGIFEDEESEQP